jgi:multiple sugar transport system permease protein
MKAEPKKFVSKTRKRMRFVENCWGFGMISVSIISILVFTIYPLIFSFVISFEKWTPIRGGTFLGFTNYFNVIKDNLFHRAMTNNFAYAFWTILAGFIFSYGAALVVWKLPFKNIFRFIYFIPTICSSIMISLIWKYLLQPQIGLVNTVLRFIGVSSPPDWIGSAATVPGVLYTIVVWAGLGYWMLIFLTGLLDIPNTYYEAATLDGAGSWRQFFYITIPLSTPIIFFYLSMALLTCWGQFDLARVLGGGGGPRNSLLFPSILIYGTSFNSMDFGRAAAMGWELAIFIFVISFINNRLSKLWLSYDR